MRVGFVYPAWMESYGIFGYFARRNSSWPPRQPNGNRIRPSGNAEKLTFLGSRLVQ
jgi:hypothetical protein